MNANATLTVKEQLESAVWDAYKDAYGIRPFHLDLEEMTKEELNEVLMSLNLVIRATQVEVDYQENVLGLSV